MANELYAFMKSCDVPTRDQWQQAIDRSNFDLKLDSERQPRTNVGFVPCTLNGLETGTEIYFDDSDEFMDSFRDLAGDRESCITFRWGGSIQECACAMVASYALASSFGALVSYEGEPADTLQQFHKEVDKVVAMAMTSK